MERHKQLALYTVKVHKRFLGISGKEPFFPRWSGRAGFTYTSVKRIQQGSKEEVANSLDLEG